MKARAIYLFLFFLTVTVANAQSANVGESELEIEGNKATVSVTLSLKAATSLLAAQVPAKEDSEVIANGEYLAVTYNTETRAYTVEESNFTNIREVRKYVKVWLREVLEVTG